VIYIIYLLFYAGVWWNYIEENKDDNIVNNPRFNC
jgi:hypothetical protein